MELERNKIENFAEALELTSWFIINENEATRNKKCPQEKKEESHPLPKVITIVSNRIFLVIRIIGIYQMNKYMLLFEYRDSSYVIRSFINSNNN